ncbi:YchJ family protein [Mycolicibacterium sp. 050158]|uniref:YchJ family protein n=1 Tax=Mycolicibacterium sp. 050158 TaxID=3090602 RepID=UPI00299D7C81|nr:YchJ family metal-binding protein [Mycolicibacterium sp. 050158]MDX1892703.1 YchJ family metal-binding protein [Mycolicibacterium sp. 050158]
MSGSFGRPCPCDTGAPYEACCGPLHHGERHAATAEQLMRSRYAAYATGHADYLFRTWHPRTRPAEVAIDPAVVWKGLAITDVVAGGPGDEAGEVEFTAAYDGGAMHERSSFVRRAGRWVYVDGG